MWAQFLVQPLVRWTSSPSTPLHLELPGGQCCLGYDRARFVVTRCTSAAPKAANHATFPGSKTSYWMSLRLLHNWIFKKFINCIIKPPPIFLRSFDSLLLSSALAACGVCLVCGIRWRRMTQLNMWVQTTHPHLTINEVTINKYSTIHQIDHTDRNPHYVWPPNI